MNFLCWHEENFRNDFHLGDCKAHFHHRTQKTIKLNKNKARSSPHENGWRQMVTLFGAMMRLNDFHHSPAIARKATLREHTHPNAHNTRKAMHKLRSLSFPCPTSASLLTRRVVRQQFWRQFFARVLEFIKFWSSSKYRPDLAMIATTPTEKR